MTTVTLTLTLPEVLAVVAGQAGLLTSESLVPLLRREVRQRRIDNLLAAMDRLDRTDTGVLAIEDIAADLSNPLP